MLGHLIVRNDVFFLQSVTLCICIFILLEDWLRGMFSGVSAQLEAKYMCEY